MKKMIMGLMLVAGIAGFCLNDETAEATSVPRPIEMHRLYNPNSGEHFYTDNVGEKDNLVKLGWRYENIGWYAPTTGDPVYRLYNPNAGDHHYTLSQKERDDLIAVGWRSENVGWHSEVQKTVPLYRAYNPNAKTGTHNYTTSKIEQNKLIALGWRDEEIGWYGTITEDGWTLDDAIEFYEAVYKNTDNEISEHLIWENYDRKCWSLVESNGGPRILLHWTNISGAGGSYTELLRDGDVTYMTYYSGNASYPDDPTVTYKIRNSDHLVL